jgi:hypothetical protein
MRFSKLALALLLVVLRPTIAAQAEAEDFSEWRTRFSDATEDVRAVVRELQQVVPRESSPERRRWPREAEELSMKIVQNAQKLEELASQAPESALAVEALMLAARSYLDALAWERIPFDHRSRYGGNQAWEGLVRAGRELVKRDPQFGPFLLPWAVGPLEEGARWGPVYGRVYYEPALEIFETSDDPLASPPCMSATLRGIRTGHSSVPLQSNSSKTSQPMPSDSQRTGPVRSSSEPLK